jgi:hypothetical protein
MKILLTILLFISFSYANHVKWLGDYDKALKQALKEHKVLMVLLIKDNCLKCKNVVKDAFTDKKYVDEINRLVVPVIVSIDHRHSYPIEMYYANDFPTLFFVDSVNETFIANPLRLIIKKDILKILDKIKHNK